MLDIGQVGLYFLFIGQKSPCASSNAWAVAFWRRCGKLWEYGILKGVELSIGRDGGGRVAMPSGLGRAAA